MASRYDYGRNWITGSPHTFTCPIDYKDFDTKAAEQAWIESRFPHRSRDCGKDHELTEATTEMVLKAVDEYIKTIAGKVSFDVFEEQSVKLFRLRSITSATTIHEEFVKRVNGEIDGTAVDWDAAIADFAKFIALGRPYYDTNYNPTLIIDLVWHAVILGPWSTRRAILEDVGIDVLPDHCTTSWRPDVDRVRHDHFLKVYELRYASKPYVPSAPRAKWVVLSKRTRADDEAVRAAKVPRTENPVRGPELTSAVLDAERTVREPEFTAAQKLQRVLDAERAAALKDADAIRAETKRVLAEEKQARWEHSAEADQRFFRCGDTPVQYMRRRAAAEALKRRADAPVPRTPTALKAELEKAAEAASRKVAPEAWETRDNAGKDCKAIADSWRAQDTRGVSALLDDLEEGCKRPDAKPAIITLPVQFGRRGPVKPRFTTEKQQGSTC